ncbi:MAG: FixH family protein [Chitinophagales bacterium]|nr:FixH family protein [Chitinophagales bacterium]
METERNRSNEINRNRLNWGWRIALLYGGFVLFMAFLVYKTTTVKDDLVTKDYYARELKFQEQIDKQTRANLLNEPLQWSVKGNEVELKFPEEVSGKSIKADVLFYKPSNAKQDVTLSCVPDSKGICLLGSGKLSKGAYQMQIEWSADDVTYYNEGTVNIH